MERSTDGICMTSCVLDPAEAAACAGDVPLVVVQSDHDGGVGAAHRPRSGSIRTDDESGMEQAVRHLVSTGHREVVYLGCGGRATNRLRQAAVERTLREMADRPARTIALPEEAWRDPASVAAALGDRPPDAVVCYDDKLALALLDGLRWRGLDVPRDVAVTGFDDIPFARLANPRLTTVATPVAEMGRLAAHSLVAAIDTGQLPEPMIMPVELAIRESTAVAGQRRRAGGRAVAAMGGR
jgi:LacI family transcriptional regulator